jgi:2-polyprenyl-3-methyl-5-hydroxy-6-metoxy-1,4-benzoquinol methylase
VLRSPRLDGPLVRCPECGLHYVGERRGDFTFAGADAGRTTALGERVDALAIVDRGVEAAEAPRRAAAERERVQRLGRHAAAGRLLDVGSALGSFLAAAAQAGFEAEGVEPDPGTSEQARARGLRVHTGTLEALAARRAEDGADAPAPPGYDVVTMFHVLEHLDSPRAALTAARALLRPGGILVVETPTVENPWFRLAPSRWRQLIPDHYFFFSRETLERLLRETGFEPLHHATVGRRVSLRFAADRLRRAGVPGARSIARAVDRAGLGDRSLHLNPGDIIEVVARARR